MPNDPRPTTSQVPYLFKAMHEWMADNNLTPHILVDALVPGVDVPISAVRDGKIVLNVDVSACSQLYFGKDVITFGARFNRVHQDIVVPYRALLAIYAKEDGRGMSFAEQQPGDDAPPPTPSPTTPPSPPPRGSHLRVVK